VGGNTIHTFTTSGTLSPITSLSASYLVVAGGGGGGGYVGGGGGAGGLLSGSGVTIDPNSTYLVTVGAGGAGAASQSTAPVAGGNSLWSMVSTAAVGGGIGSIGGGVVVPAWFPSVGGSGGGGGSTVNVPSRTGAAGTSGQGNAGGSSPGLAANYPSGGGGGAGAVGQTPANTSSAGGNGGIGVTSSISGTSTYYAGGGGGCAVITGGTGGLGGGGNGCVYNSSGSYVSGGSAGTANTGGGGGGGVSQDVGGNGGSGVVIISYPGSTAQMSGGTVTIVGGNVIHTFTSSGYLSPIVLLNRSLRFRSSATAYFNRTFGSPTSSTIWTWSGWVKLGSLSINRSLFSAFNGSGTAASITINGSDQLQLESGGVIVATSTAVFRDPSAWYHIVCSVNGSSTTIYVNNASRLTYSGGALTSFNTNTVVHNIGRRLSASPDFYFDGYLTEINFIDGQALTPSSFGTINSYGVWQPITYGGSYGTNGFYLPFTNNASTTTLGYDFSPQGNNWTTNNISVTAGSTYDSMTDVPTLTSATAANFNTLNPAIRPYTVTPAEIISNGNLTLTCSSSGVSGSAWGTQLLTTGKWYFEATLTTAGPSNNCVGFSNNTVVAGQGTYTSDARGFGWFYQSSGQKTINGSTTSYNSSYTTGDVIGVALDIDNLTITFYKNNTSQGQLTGLSLATGSAGWLAAVEGFNGTVWNANFGQQPFTYTPPSGFVALNTYNL